MKCKGNKRVVPGETLQQARERWQREDERARELVRIADTDTAFVNIPGGRQRLPVFYD